MLRLASNLLDADDEGLLASIASVIFMGCPLTGTDYGSMVIAMKSMAAATTGVAVDDDVLARMLGGDEDAQLAYLGRDAFEAVRREYNFGVKVYRETNAEQSLEYWAELGLVRFPTRAAKRTSAGTVLSDCRLYVATQARSPPTARKMRISQATMRTCASSRLGAMRATSWYRHM